MVRLSTVRVAAILALAGFVGCPFLGDHFFRATGRVVDCNTLNPVADAEITVFVDRGDEPGPYDSGVANRTSATGQFDVHTALRPGSWITLIFKKAGYTPLMYQFKGQPTASADLCMIPSGSP